MTNRPSARLRSVAFLLLLAASSSHATKHSVHVIDGPSLIGPVGPPFGFLRGGYYELTIQQFSFRTAFDTTAAIDAGFFLKRFDNEAAFYHYLEELRSDRLCSFELFRQDVTDDLFPADNSAADDYVDDLAYQEQQQQQRTATNGIVLHVDHPESFGASSSPSSSSPESPSPTTIRYQFQQGEEGLYFLLYQVCGGGPHDADHDPYRSTFIVDFHYMNYDAFGNPSFLTAGEMRLPMVFFLFSVSYLVCAIVWILHIRDIQQSQSSQQHRGPMTVYKIHYIMAALIVTKFLATFVESLRYHGIRVNGHAQGWTVLYYIFTMIRGVFLFVVILLLGTGWSIVKPFLNPREKQVVAGVLVLQVLNQIALVVLEHLAQGETPYATWTAVLHLVDIACCCAVLVPIVWQVNQLEKTMGDDEDDDGVVDGHELVAITEEDRELALQDGDKGEVVSKLRLFRSFYLLVVAYIYATRILVYLFASMLSYKYLWVRYFVVELVTLTFYVSVGMMFRPMSDNPYVSVKRDEDGDDGVHAAVEMRTKSKT